MLKQFKIALGMLNFMKERAIYFVDEFGRLISSICYLIQVCYLESSLKKEQKTNNLLIEGHQFYCKVSRRSWDS